FKLSRGLLLTQRLMLGVRTRDASPQAVLRIADRLGMPSVWRATLLEQLPHANVVLFGAEEGPGETVLKLYLEFWDEVRERVRSSGSKTPQLLDLGFKWRAGDERANRVARYTCFPLLTTAECVSRIDVLHADAPDRTARGLAADLIGRCAARNPRAAFVYMEAEEDTSPRRSFDINLYKAGMRLGELRDWLREAQRHYAIDARSFDAFCESVSDKVLGHLSGGLDRHGRDFMTVYYEIEAL
ncbi:MAG TPA: hypothetical protein VJ743_02300, partial [Albitalea sp.]|nr:hypothetical protein [Albitalea sp.]